MKTLGIDIGSLTTKIVLIDSGKLVASKISRSLHNFQKIGKELYEKLLSELNLTPSDIETIYSTGYGRHSIPELTTNVISEISAHAKGVQYSFPKVRSVIDIGGQDSKVIKLDPNSGNVIDFQMNDKCAAGTGRFLEVMADALEIPIDQMGDLALTAKKSASISSTCTVFAESEIIGLFAQGTPKEEIAAGIHTSIAKRIAAMAKRVRVEPPIIFCGGVALNLAVKVAIEQELGENLQVAPNPQLTGALGAALIGFEKMKG